MKSKKNAHHHGNLRIALIEAGAELIRENGADALSIRKAAAIAGVSHAAPAHHFPTLKHLRTAVAAYGHDIFSHSMRTKMDAITDPDPHRKLLAAGQGYLEFALNNPALYDLMFGGSSKFPQDEEFLKASAKSLEILAEIAAPLRPGTAGDEGNQLLVWSILHGFCGIVLNEYGVLVNAEHGVLDRLENASDLLENIFPHLPMRDDI